MMHGKSNIKKVNENLGFIQLVIDIENWRDIIKKN
jgi:hypothetical protein